MPLKFPSWNETKNTDLEIFVDTAVMKIYDSQGI